MKAGLAYIYSNLATLILLVFSAAPLAGNSQGLVINEVMMKNENYQIIDGDSYDWLEVYNSSSSPIQLNTFYLTDKLDNTQKWNFPDTILAANDFLVIVASNLDIITSNFIHSNFTLSSNDEGIYLTDGISFIDSLTPTQTPTDLSFGRISDGLPQTGILVHPSIGSTNNFNNAIVSSTSDAIFSESFSLFLNPIQPDSIHFTTNGSDPTPASSLYSNSIWLEHDITSSNNFSTIPTTATQDLISFHAWQDPSSNVQKCHTLKYASFRNGLRTSPVYAQTFIPSDHIGELNILSIISDSSGLFGNNSGIYVPGVHFQTGNPEWTGNFFQKGLNWTRAADVAFIKNSGEISLNQKVEIKISGGKTRHAGQKSIAISAKSELSDNLIRHNLFPDDKPHLEKSIVLKTTFGDWGIQSMMKDILIHSICKDMNIKTLNHEYVDVYINGEYWGIQSIRERNSSSNLGLIFGDEDLPIDVLNPSSLTVDNGTVTAFENLKLFVENSDLAVPSNYQFIEEQIDIPTFIDYYIAEIFFANYDWPVNNNKIWRANDTPDKWRQLLFDMDACFPIVDYNMMRHVMRNDEDVFWPNPAKSTLLFRKLFANADFKTVFMKRFDVLLKTTLSKDNTLKKLDEIQSSLSPNVQKQIDRWGYPVSFDSWESDVDNLRGFLQDRPCVMADHLNEYIDESQLKVSCDLDYDNSVDIIIFPNPTDTDVKIKFLTGEETNVNIELSDLQGKSLKTLNFDNHHIAQVIYLDLSDYAQGNYILSIKRGSQRKTVKVVKY